MASVLWGKQFCLDSLDIGQIFKLVAKGIAIFARKTYNEKLLEYFEVGK